MIFQLDHEIWSVRLTPILKGEASLILVLLGLLVVASYFKSVLSVHFAGDRIPVVGVKSKWEPRLVANWRFFKDNVGVVGGGYQRFRDKAFKFVRNDADMIVLPARYVDEINELPIDVANPTLAHAHNLFGGYTGMDLILRGNLHFRMIQQKLTPRLAYLTDPMQEEVCFAMEHDFPDATDWITIKPYHLLLHCVARVSARVFVGLPKCRDETWLDISTKFTENIFISVVIMRLLPTWTLPLVTWLLPSLYSGSGYIRKSQRFLVDEIQRRQALLTTGKWDTSSDQAQNLLSWMIECAEGKERDPSYLAHLQVVVSLASIHTTQMNTLHVLYDLAQYPEYVAELRREIEGVQALDGGWKKTSYSKLRKLDSFLRESQRMSPPSVLSLHRVMQQTHTLRDGQTLPMGTHICMPTHAIQNDPKNTPDPQNFDGFRSARKRDRSGEGSLHQFATTEREILNFGYGRYSCPGRFFASLEIKVILVKMVMDFDIKFLPGEGRPQNLRAHEFIFPNPEGQLMIKRRSERSRSPF